MKMFNAKDTKKTSQKKVWIFILLIGMLAVGTISCDEDDNDDNNTVTPEPEEPEEVASAWLTGYFTATPNGRLYYMEVNENIPDETDVSNAVELGLGNRILSFGEHPYSWNDAAGTLTKWNVDRTTLEFSVDGIVSFASNGISGNIGLTIVIASETEGYVQDIFEGQIVEFNPSTMEITQAITFDLPPVPNANPTNGIYFVNDPVFIPETQKILYGISYFPTGCCDYDGPNGLIVGVFDTQSKTMEYKQDSRLLAAETLIPSGDGFVYAVPSAAAALIRRYMNIDPSVISTVPNVLRIDADGNIDPSFSFNYLSVLPTEWARPIEIASGNLVPFSYADSAVWKFGENWDNRFDSFSADDFTPVTIDIVTGGVTPFTAFDQYQYASFNHTTNGVDFTVAGTFAVPDENIEEVSYVLRREDGFNYTQLTKHVGGSMQRMAQLW
ncbi:MAG: hypothetical protein AAF632_03605 [Bacteroidota bacterium]